MKGFTEEVPAGQLCITCGKDAKDSLYWTPMLDETWAVVREFVAPLFEDADHIQNVLFNADYNKPYCGASCVPQRLTRSDENGSKDEKG